jgi:hypothetical protein
MQARYYDPLIGRFYSNDPVDVLGYMSRGNIIHGFNRFAYGNNNPYKFTDPTGMAPEDMFKPLRGFFNSPQKQAAQLKQDAGSLANSVGEGAVNGAKIVGDATKEGLGPAALVTGLIPGGQGVSAVLTVADVALNGGVSEALGAGTGKVSSIVADEILTNSGTSPGNLKTRVISAVVSTIIGDTITETVKPFEDKVLKNQ